VENSIDEAELYLTNFPDRKAVIVSESYRNDKLSKIAYNQVQTFKKGQIRIVDKKDNNDMNNVIDTISAFLKNGIVVIQDCKINSNTLKGMLLRKNSNSQDIIIHRNVFKLDQSEVDFVNSQIEKANKCIDEGKHYLPEKNVYFRIHASQDFKFNRDYIISLINEFGEELGATIFLSQFILLKKKNEYRKMLELECEKSEEKFEDFVDPYWFNRESSAFVYINLITKDIVGATPQFIEQCKLDLQKAFEDGKS
jgi:hypothetical protein